MSVATAERTGAALSAPGRVVVQNAPEGVDARFIAALAGDLADGVVVVARDDQRLAALQDLLKFFAPDLKPVILPAWDCLPYDRSSPNRTILSERMRALGDLAENGLSGRVMLTTVNAVTQRLLPREEVRGGGFRARVGKRLDQDELIAYLANQGYTRTGTVMEPGEFAVRGGLIDIYPPNDRNPVRLDLFGNELDGLRRFDAMTQRTLRKIRGVMLSPVSELVLETDRCNRFRARYRETFGNRAEADPLYESVSEGRPFPGMEHWLPLFHRDLETVFDYAGDAAIVLDHLSEDAAEQRFQAIADYYATRKEAAQANQGGAGAAGAPYRPLPPEMLYLTKAELAEALGGHPVGALTPFAVTDKPDPGVIDLGGRQGRDFAKERAVPGANVYEALVRHIEAVIGEDRRVVMASYSDGARQRLSGMLRDSGVPALADVGDFAEAQALHDKVVGLAVLPLEHGFEDGGTVVISEQDVLGDRLVRKRRQRRRSDNFIANASDLQPGDLVVHADHGIGRYEGLETLDINGAPHDCLLLTYDGGDKLYLPVENIELLSRYGSGDGSEAVLDRLGGKAWQSKKARLKQRLKDMAEALIKVAAARELAEGQRLEAPAGAYHEFCDRFAFQETEDQARAIGQMEDDLAAGRPMDRLVCGDVGFGKTEVALRAAFIAAMEGVQVAVIAPTTLLVRQHYRTFVERFRDFPVRIGQLSRLATPKDAKATKDGLKDGGVDIVIGTHALLSKTIGFRRLGLLIVDEEQHFGVKHKERLKELKDGVHVLTLTATPIPRTLQLALTGIRDLSIIATPPVDRLAVRTFVMPFDEVVVREALLREHYRGGQSFFVCPRISDLPTVEEFLRDHVPEVKFVVAHGQMPVRDLEDAMHAFDEGRYDVLVSTNIVESGLDVPNANTMILYRADMFGLAQTYQLRGRIGRSKTRAYAYLTVPANKKLTDTADRRLRVLQTLDQLGAGFSLASHDLDIRGAGNLLGEEQSGQIREVGVELYQSMLEEAVAEARGTTDAANDQSWSPNINLGAPVLIPEHYVPDLSARLDLYRRLAHVADTEEIEGIAAEMIDRFGPLPHEVDSLFEVMTIKRLCRTANIAKLDAGPKGATLHFRENRFPDPGGLVRFISGQSGTAKLRPDHTMVYLRNWDDVPARVKGVRMLVRGLAKIVEEAGAAA
ncbi:MAG: transcription-repair coupling factor [Minwuia sp.]|uniref:transcription-repair coupling factor n=1 Tax=Minwuia sp. TaxID=2493630 RepID=UPI003A863F47